MICTDYSYLVQEICFVEVTCPIMLRSVLPNHDPRWLRDCMRRGRRSPRSLCCGTGKSEIDSIMPITNRRIKWYFQVFLGRLWGSYEERSSRSFPAGHLKQTQMAIGISHAELVAVLRESHASYFGESARCSWSSDRRLMSPLP